MEPDLDRRTILLVDDVELFLELEKTFFHRDRFDLMMAVNAQEVMQLVLQRRPDLVFLDLHLSGAGGDAVCRWIKQDQALKSLPVIMLVESGDSEAESLCRQAGCDAIIHSPVKRQQLLSVARKILAVTDRQQARIPARMQVDFGEHSNQLRTNYSVNLSHGGVFIATQEVVPVGSPLALQISIPDAQRPLRCRGRVAWLNHTGFQKKPHMPTGMGIAFDPLSDPELELVQTYLNLKTA